MTDRILVTGGAGQVGQALQKACRSRSLAKTEWLFPDRAALDLTSEESIRSAFTTFEPTMIINLAAYTAVDRAEEEPALCAELNVNAPALLARLANHRAVPLIHISTDYVFAGDRAAPYREDDPSGPINIYGRTKWEGEEAIRAATPDHVILRASWIVSSYRTNFIKTMLRLAADRDVIAVVADQTGSPTSADDLAHALLTIADRHLDGRGLIPGTFHFSNAGTASWADLAEKVMAVSAALGGPSAEIKRIESKDYPTKARRPLNSRLDTQKIRDRYAILARNWQDAVTDIVKDLGGKV